MQLPPSADLLIPVGVGVLVAVVAVVALVIGLRRRVDDASVPTHDDWTGEHVGDVAAPPTRTVADAVAARQGNTGPFLVVSPERGADEQDVADSGADAPARKREAIKGPALPFPARGSEVITSVLGVGRPRRTVQVGARATSVALAAGAAPTAGSDARPTAANGASPAPATVLTAEARHCRSADDGDGPTYPSDPLSVPAPEPAHPLAAGPAVPPPSAGGMGQERSREHRPAAEGLPAASGSYPARGADPSADGPPVAGGAPAGLSADGHPAAGGVGSAPAGLSVDGHPVAGTDSGPANADPSTAHPAADAAGPAAGSSQSVAAAVAQVLAARAAAQVPDDRRGDARDRLLAVLLDDPMRAVGAAVDLQECQERLDRLTASLKDEHGRLGDVLGRLACSGLRPDQLARLSGLSDIEVAELLRRGSGARTQPAIRRRRADRCGCCG